MNCLFCQDHTKVHSPEPISEFKCTNCLVTFFVNNDDTIGHYIKDFEYNGKRYTAYWFIDDRQEDKIRFTLWNSLQLLIRWEFSPNITPFNIIQKLPTLLTFL